MYGEGDDPGHRSYGLTSRDFRTATTKDRLIYRRWIGGMIVFYCVLLLVSGVVAFTNTGSRTQVSKVPGSQVNNQAIASSRPN
jgi:hypothetical protein